jgi:hypothetical protein
MSPPNYHRHPKRQAAVRIYNASPRGRYQAHKLNSKTRGIEFSLTFEEWFSVWKDHWNDRGRGKGKYHMGRFGDVGAYAMGNVYLVKHEVNCAEDKPRALHKKGTHLPLEIIAEMLKLYASGLSYRAVARKFEISGATVMRYVKQALLEHEGHK